MAVKDISGQFIPIDTKTHRDSAFKKAKGYKRQSGEEVFVFPAGEAIFRVDEKGQEHDLG